MKIHDAIRYLDTNMCPHKPPPLRGNDTALCSTCRASLAELLIRVRRLIIKLGEE